MSQVPEASVMDVTDAEFMERVVEESKTRPVVVDFWADWCGPCKTLGPVLERLVEERGGDVVLAKVDVDRNPYVAGQLRVQSIPNVWAFKDGRPVDQFVGALPEDAVRRWLDKLTPSEADREAASAAEAEQAGDVEGAEKRYRDVLASDPANREARLGLGRILAERSDVEEARQTLKPLLPDPEAERLLAAMRIADWSSVAEDDPLAAPRRMAADGAWSEALAGFLGAVRHSPDARDEARQAMLDVFAVLGDDDPLTREYRGKLAAALF
jgi:putative thioredoxin